MRVVLLVLALFAPGLRVHAQSEIRADIVPSEIAAGQTATLRISVNVAGGNVPDIPVPRLPNGLNVVGTSQSTQISFSAPGGRTARLVREFSIQATQPGSYTIPPVSITLDGRTERTTPLQLNVTGQASPTSGTTTEDARLNVELSPNTVYVGQQVTLTGELLVTPELQLRMTRPPGHEAPAPANFWLHELPTSRTAELKTIDGRRFVGQQFHRAYFPLIDGQFQFAPARVSFEAREGFLFAPREIQLRSRSPRLTVLPLPENGRPDDFKGAVGQFNVASKLEPQQISVGDAVTLTLVVRGSGNMKALPAPVLPPMDEFDVLPPTEAGEVTLDGLRVGGEKTFSWVLVPTREGRVTIPPIRYPAFDPERHAYVVHRTDSLKLEVLPGGVIARPVQLAPIRRTASSGKLDWVTTPGFLFAQLIPVAAVLLLVVGKRRRARRTSTIAPSHLVRDLRAHLDDPEFAARAEQAVLELARLRLGEPIPSSISIAEFEARLAATGDNVATSAAALLDDVRRLRYAPGLPDRDAREHVLARLEALARFGSPPSSQPVLSLAPVLFLPLLLQLSAATDFFSIGVDAVDKSRADDAIAAFEQHIREHPRDASAWYNLGVAQNQAGHRGSAAYAWLRAAQLEPRAADITTNLRAIGADDLLARVQPLTMLNRAESFLLAAVLWWIAVGLAGSAILLRSRARPLLATSVVPLLLSGLLLASWAIQYALPPVAVVLDRGASLVDAPNRQSETVAPLPPATGVVILERADVWSHVRLDNGVTGWVENSDLAEF